MADSIRPLWRDFLELSKPKVVLMMLITAVIGMFLAVPGWPSWSLFFYGLVGIGFAAGSAATINHLLDQRIDKLMARTTKRPLPQQRVTQSQAILMAVLLAICSILILHFKVNALTMWLTLASLVGYAFVYTLYLKRATPQNIVIGGLSGAMPPLLGWSAMIGEVHPHALLLVLIIFVWTPPHFWSLAVYRYDDYVKAGVPMLPVTHGIPYTKLNILLYTILLALVTLLPVITAMSGWCYLIGVVVLNVLFIRAALTLYRCDERANAIKTFHFSNIYLLCLFLLLLLDHVVFWPVL